LSSVVIEAMAAAARGAGLGPLIAPVRPSWTDRYPLIPIAVYADWQRCTGLLPAAGLYVFPGGLAPLTVTDGIGEYWEPNVWMLHPASWSATATGRTERANMRLSNTKPTSRPGLTAGRRPVLVRADSRDGGHAVGLTTASGMAYSDSACSEATGGPETRL
jgi:hypothetical protein